MENQDLYDKYCLGEHWKNHPTVYAEDFSAFLLSQGIRPLVIDIGCGTGRDVRVFAKYFPVIGIDKDPRAVISARLDHSSLGFHFGDVEALEIERAIFGACFMINVIHYVDQAKAFKEIFRILKAGGYLFIHFNLEIVAYDGRLDYHQDEEAIVKLISPFRIARRKVFERFDAQPTAHTHKILELILQKI